MAGSGRLARRLVRHHVPLALMSAVLVWCVYQFFPVKDGFQRLGIATAYASLLLLAATLMIGPINLLRRRPNPVSSDIRRDVGIWAGIVGVIHTIIGLQVHLRGKMWTYFFYDQKVRTLETLRFDSFGWANHTGVLATCLLLLLLLLSNDLSLRTLRTKGWKVLQRLNYLLLAIVVVHSLLYQQIEKRPQLYVVLFGVVVAAILISQIIGVVLYVQRRAARSRARVNT